MKRAVAPAGFEATTGATTVTVAVAVFPVPPLVEDTDTELFLMPAVVPTTFTETVQVASAATVPPERLTVADPAVAVAVPPQLLVKADGVATASPAGRLSLNATPVWAPARL